MYYQYDIVQQILNFFILHTWNFMPAESQHSTSSTPTPSP